MSRGKSRAGPGAKKIKPARCVPFPLKKMEDKFNYLGLIATKPFQSEATALLQLSCAGETPRCFHIVTRGLHTAVAHMGKRTRRRDNPITPTQPGRTPAEAPLLVRALLRSFPQEKRQEFPETRSGLKGPRGSAPLGNLTWWKWRKAGGGRSPPTPILG